MKYFEDMNVSEKCVLGPRVIDLESILAFASQFDRQPFHLDETAAKNSIYQGIIASGIHTLAITTSLIVDEYLGDKAVIGGLGINDLLFLRPVRPGDLLTVEVHVQTVVPHKKRNDMGVVRIAVTTRNRINQAAMSCSVDYGFAKRPINIQEKYCA